MSKFGIARAIRLSAIKEYSLLAIIHIQGFSVGSRCHASEGIVGPRLLQSSGEVAATQQARLETN